MKQKRTFWGRMLSVFLALALFMSGLATPVQAGELTGLQDIPEENAAPEPEEETPENAEEAVPLQEQPSVYFQYDDGSTQQMAEDNSFTLSAVDSGRFVLTGTDKVPDWNFSGKWKDMSVIRTIKEKFSRVLQLRMFPAILKS